MIERLWFELCQSTCVQQRKPLQYGPLANPRLAIQGQNPVWGGEQLV
ncbi:MAG: hypothetical protein OHK0011_07310 [Turneriella sp.]